MLSRLLLALALLFAPLSSSASLLTLTQSRLDLFATGIPLLSNDRILSIPVNVSSGDGGFSLTVPFASLTTGTPGSVPLISRIDFQIGLTAFAVNCAGGCEADAGLTGNAFLNLLGLLNLVIPLGAVGDNTVATHTIGNLSITVDGGDWATTGTGFDNRGPGHGGVMRLVTPFTVSVYEKSGALLHSLSGMGGLTLAFVPEPGIALMMLAGGAGLVWYGRHRA